MPRQALHSSALAVATPAKVESAGCDWLTTTAVDDAAGPLGDLAETIIRSQSRLGNDAKPWRWNGYHGTIVQGCAAGSRPDSLIVRLSGECAREWWADCYRVTGRASRFDLQVTLEGLPPGVDLAGEHQRQVEQHKPKSGRPAEWAYLRTKSSGATLYVGRRRSDRFYRVYDKGAEDGDGHLTGRWRYELEAKEDVAKLLATWMLERRSAERATMDLLHHEFTSRGVTPPYRRMGRPPEIAPRAEPTDDERRLKWLAEQVSRTVAALIAAGHTERVYRALGLPTPDGEIPG